MLGIISSIATLLLFIIYFVGRTITIYKTRSIFEDGLKVGPHPLPTHDCDIVESITLNNNPYNTCLLTSKQGIYSITIYSIQRDDAFIESDREKVFDRPFLNCGQSIEISLTFPELLHDFILEYYTPDFKKVTIPLWQNLKNGCISESVSISHTFKSVCYYLFR